MRAAAYKVVMPALVAGIKTWESQDVDGTSSVKAHFTLASPRPEIPPHHSGSSAMARRLSR